LPHDAIERKIGTVEPNMSDASPKPKALLVTGDLIFSTKVTGTGRALGIDVEVTANPADAVRRIGQGDYGCVILDLSMPQLIPAEVIAAIREGDGQRPKVIAFGSHVDTALLEAARAAGCDDIMPRSRFAAELPQLLERFARH